MFVVLHRKRPAGGCLVGAGTDEGELAGVPATLDDLVLVLGDDDAGQLTHQVTCALARHVTSRHTHTYQVKHTEHSESELISCTSIIQYMYVWPRVHVQATSENSA